MRSKRLKLCDAYGESLWDFYNGKPSVEIVERDDGYVSAAQGLHGAPGVYFSAYKNWSAIEKEAMRYVRGSVLDIGCGAGRHALYLQNKGHTVVGIDASPLAIKVCKLRGLKKARVLPIGKVGRFRSGSFDSVILMGNNFGLFGSSRRARRFLKQLDRITSKNGRIIAETTDPHRTRDADHQAYHRWNVSRGRMPGQLRLRIRCRNVIGPWMDYLFVSENELKGILQGTGWVVRHIIDSSQTPSVRYAMVLEKQ
jgi:SAM-dependent methyltransferase